MLRPQRGSRELHSYLPDLAVPAVPVLQVRFSAADGEVRCKHDFELSVVVTLEEDKHDLGPLQHQQPQVEDLGAVRNSADRSVVVRSLEASCSLLFGLARVLVGAST